MVYLLTGLALILAFVGVKLVLHWGHDVHNRVPEISTGFSLSVIVAVLAATTLLSLAAVRRNPQLRAHAGSLAARKADADSPGT